MRNRSGLIARSALCFLVGLSACVLLQPGCASGGMSYYQMVLGHSPFTNYSGSSGQPQGGGGSSFFDSGSRTNIDPCTEPLSRKIIRISMRSLCDGDYVHYFLILIAYVNGETYPDGAVCADDIQLYRNFGYVEIAEGREQVLGNYCIRGPALYYFHRSGQFRGGSGTGGSSLGSAIAPAQGSSAAYDTFFTSSGAQVPIPNLILFHNPGTGGGRSLKVFPNRTDPCSLIIADFGVSDCNQDAFYYVDESDRMTGSTALGPGAGLRVPNDIQGTGCLCLGTEDAFQSLAPSGTSASRANCNEFLRGGRIEYVFLRDDTEPPFPQLLWRVTDQNGGIVHDFDPSAPRP